MTLTQPHISERQLREWDEGGATILDGPFSSEQIAETAAVITRLHAEKKLGGAADYLLDPEILDIIQHPFLEEAAKTALRCDEVEFLALAARRKDPHPEKRAFVEHEHIDVAYGPEDMAATPRRMIASLLVWFTDVTTENGPMLVRPGSHHTLANHFGKPAPCSENYLGLEHLPDLGFTELEPILAKAGQISLLTTATVHSASSNVADVPRIVMFTMWAPKGLHIEVNMREYPQRLAYYTQLREHLRPERRHIVPSIADRAPEIPATDIR